MGLGMGFPQCSNPLFASTMEEEIPTVRNRVSNRNGSVPLQWVHQGSIAVEEAKKLCSRAIRGKRVDLSEFRRFTPDIASHFPSDLQLVFHPILGDLEEYGAIDCGRIIEKDGDDSARMPSALADLIMFDLEDWEEGQHEPQVRDPRGGPRNSDNRVRWKNDCRRRRPQDEEKQTEPGFGGVP